MVENVMGENLRTHEDPSLSFLDQRPSKGDRIESLAISMQERPAAAEPF
jgi:hypothetical protein